MQLTSYLTPKFTGHSEIWYTSSNNNINKIEKKKCLFPQSVNEYVDLFNYTLNNYVIQRLVIKVIVILSIKKFRNESSTKRLIK